MTCTLVMYPIVRNYTHSDITSQGIVWGFFLTSRASAVRSPRSASQESLKASKIILSTRYRRNPCHQQHDADHHRPVNLFFAAQKKRGETDNEERRGID